MLVTKSHQGYIMRNSSMQSPKRIDERGCTINCSAISKEDSGKVWREWSLGSTARKEAGIKSYLQKGCRCARGQRCSFSGILLWFSSIHPTSPNYFTRASHLLYRIIAAESSGPVDDWKAFNAISIPTFESHPEDLVLRRVTIFECNGHTGALGTTGLQASMKDFSDSS